ncbi:hypothetical protein [Paenibacillus wynnii]|uniref:hypothetical protein n=1 Tax=Paenibacillus wynnii TaxID=268407 RepID=UPI0027D7D8B3|nr:hypothetical protein [Paenibacillus wynnii]
MVVWLLVVGWLVVGCLVVWLFGWLVVWLLVVGWLFGCLVVCLVVGCLVVWLFGCLVVWLFGCWLVGEITALYTAISSVLALEFGLIALFTTKKCPVEGVTPEIEKIVVSNTIKGCFRRQTLNIDVQSATKVTKVRLK